MPNRAEFRLLGAFSASVDGGPVVLGGPRQRTVLALLLLAHGQPVSTPRLLDLVWDGEPPPTAASTLHVYIARLRKSLGRAGAAVRTTPLGYVLAVSDDDVDEWAFESRVDAAINRAGADPEVTSHELRTALELWRGPLLSDGLGGAAWAVAPAARLSERRAQAIELLAESELQLGRGIEPTMLQEAIAEYPYRERLVSLLMTALYRAGRQADALAAYDECRRRLVDGLGIDPSAKLRDIHAAVLEQRADLMAAPAAWRPPPNVPARNPRFEGRADVLRQVSAALAANRLVACTGLGGIGKTSVAVEFAHRHAGYVCWLSANNAGALSNSIAALTATPAHADLDEQERLRRLWRALGTEKDPLVVFDGAAHPDDVAPYLPPHDAVRVLVTSRDAAWGGLGAAVAIPAFSSDEAAGVLLRTTGSIDQAHALELARELGFLPLAVGQAAAFIDGSKIEIGSYLSLYTTRRSEMLLRGNSPGRQDTVGTTWAMSFDQLAAESPPAARLLEAMAFLSPEAVPTALLRPLVESADADLEIIDAIAHLRRYSLVERHGDALRVHPLVQAATRTRLGAAAVERLEQVLALLGTAEPGDPQDADLTARWSELVPHLIVAAELAHELSVATEPMVRLLARAGRHFKFTASFGSGRTVLGLAIGMAEAMPAGLTVAGELRSDLGDLLDAGGDLWGARDEHQRAVVALEAELDDGDVRLARARLRLAHTLTCAGEPLAAIVLQRQVMGVLRGGGVDDVIRGLIDLGYAHWTVGHLHDAADAFSEAIATIEGHNVTNRPDYPDAISGLGMVYQDGGDLDRAVALYGDAITLYEQAHGHLPHPDTAQVHDKLGYALRLTGDVSGALAAHRRAENVLAAAFGPDDPRVAMTVTNRGLAHLAGGDLDEAIAAQERALDAFRSAYGPGHQHAVMAADRLAQAQAALGRAAAIGIEVG